MFLIKLIHIAVFFLGPAFTSLNINFIEFSIALFDPDYGPGQAPHEVGRQQFGNISIANSDAGARAYLDEAINQGYRAVSELLG